VAEHCRRNGAMDRRQPRLVVVRGAHPQALPPLAGAQACLASQTAVPWVVPEKTKDVELRLARRFE